MTSARIKQKALRLGYLGCGVIPAGAVEDYSQRLDERVSSFPQSKERYESLYKLAKPREGGKSIIVCTRRFNQYKIPDSLDGLVGKIYLVDSRVAYSGEHRATLEFEAFLGMLGLKIIRGRVPDRWAAAKAGLGKFGHNNFIYSEEHGSQVWIDAWVVDKELDYDSVEPSCMPACSDKCHKCIQACPTKALSGSFSMDISKCITHLMYRDDMPDESLWPHLGTWLYGCDICQDVCPYNQGKFVESEEFPLLAEFEDHLKPERLLGIDEETYRGILQPRFWYTDEDESWIWKRNALRSMINSGDAKHHDLIRQSCNHEDPRVREVAEWGCRECGLRPQM